MEQLNRIAAASLFLLTLPAGAHPCTVVCEGGFQNIVEVHTGNIVAADPSVVETFDTLGNRTGFTMTYTDADLMPLSNAIMAIATSTDGINWTPSDTPDPDPGIIVRGRTMDEAVETSGIFDVGSFLMLYATSYWTPVGNYDIPGYFIPADLFLYISFDSLLFNLFYDFPIMARTPGWYTNDGIYSPDIIWDETRFVMAYNAFCYFDCSGIPEDGGGFIMTAESFDGLVWTQHQTPIISPAGASGPEWRSGDIKTPSIVKHNGEYLIFFLADDSADPANTSLGLAYSDSLSGPWTIAPEPILQPEPGTFYEYQVQAPDVIMDGDTVRMWFFAAADPNTFSIGYGTALLEDLR